MRMAKNLMESARYRRRTAAKDGGSSKGELTQQARDSNYILDEPEELRQQTRDSNYIIAEQDSSDNRLATTTTTAKCLMFVVWIKLQGWP
jgi:hypothetical protein